MIKKRITCSVVACCLMFWSFFCVSKTLLPSDPLKGKPIIFVTHKLYDGNLGGLMGANQICQREAYSKGSLIPPGLKFSALIVTAKHYPCDGTGQCGGTHASSDWPLVPSTIYYHPDGKKFNVVNKNAVFDGQNLVLEYPNGKAVPKHRKIWSGVQGILSNSTANDVIAWSSADANKEKDHVPDPTYGISDCLGFTSNSLVKNGSAGEIGVKAGTAEGSVPSNTWGNFYTCFDNAEGFLYNMWVTGEVLLCSASAALVCVSP